MDQFGNKKPLHYREITEKALELGWLVTEGKTPEATMYELEESVDGGVHEADIARGSGRNKLAGEQGSRFLT